MKNFIIGLSDQDAAAIDQAMDVLQRILGDFCISHTDEERSATPAIADRRWSFAMRAYDYAQIFPDLLPGNRDLAYYTRIHSDWTRLTSLLRRMRIVNQKLDDATLHAGANHYDYSLTFYDSVQENLGDDIPGLTTVVQDLSSQFEDMGPRPGTGPVITDELAA